MIETQFDTTEHGDPRLRITLTGAHDYFRFAFNMLDDQVEFSRTGSEVLTKLRDHMGPTRFDPWARSLLGEERYVQQVIDTWGEDRTFTGRFDCKGEDPGDLWRLEIHGGRAVRVKPRIVWPDGTEEEVPR